MQIFPHRKFLGILMGLIAFFAMLIPQNASLAQVQFRFPSPSGSFLAGQFAFKGLSTSDAASALMEAANAKWDNPSVIERAFAALVADGRINEAQPVARRMLELVPNNTLAKVVLATIALKERRYASVLNVLDDVGQSDFVDISAKILRAWARVGQSDLAKAYQELDSETNDALQNFYTFHKALMADLSGSPLAEDFARKAHESDPFLGRILELYARILANSGKPQEALKALDDYENQGLTHPSVDYVRAEIQAGRLPGKFATSIPDAAAEVFQAVGVALGRDGSTDVAMVFMQLGLYLNPDADAIALSVAELFEINHRYEAANEVYSHIGKTSLYKASAVVNTARNIDSLGDRPEAIRRLRNIVAIHPKNIEALVALGDLLRFDEQYDESAKAYSMIIDVVGGDHPRDWRYFYMRGIANERRGEWDQAESDFLHALDLNPTQPQVLNYLGYSWVDNGMNLQRALSMIEQAVRTNPSDGYIVDSLGWAMFKLNRFDEAVVVLERAVQLNPNDPEINDHLGDAYWRVGRKHEAYFQWNIALEMDQDGNVTTRVQPKLQNGLADMDAASEAQS